jgi:hypothetical protein
MLVGTITKYGDLGEDDYCPSCGQRLDWGWIKWLDLKKKIL